MALQKGSLTCPLCIEKAFANEKALKNHFKNVHVKHSVRLEDKLAVLCKLQCGNLFTGHYHCPYCERILDRSKRLFLHYHRHYISKKLPYDMQLQKSAAGSERSVCVDLKQGLFLVLKSFLYRCDEPIHVVRNEVEQLCSESLCVQAMEKARENGCPMMCKHLLRVNSDQLNVAPQFEFSDAHLQEFGLLPDERERCVAIHNDAVSKGVSSVVSWVASEAISYFSVYCTAHFAIFTRTLVKYDAIAAEFECNCPHELNHFCPYKILAQTYTKIVKTS